VRVSKGNANLNALRAVMCVCCRTAHMQGLSTPPSQARLQIDVHACSWLGGVLFPQRTKRIEEEHAQPQPQTAPNAPYGRLHEPPQQAPHAVGHAGGSQFAKKRTEKPQENVQTGLDPYQPPSAQEGAGGGGPAPYGAQQQQGGGGIFGALGDKARRDMQATQGAFGKFAKNFTEQQQKSTGQYGQAPAGGGPGVSVTGSERAQLVNSHNVRACSCLFKL
jgi:hypothetical protein